MKRHTNELKLLADYTLLNFNELMGLDCITFRLLLRDAFVHKMAQTKDGVEYLETAWILEQTTPNREHLRDVFKK